MENTETWTIVKFVDDLSVAAVPTKWIHNGLCLWPTFSSEKLTNAIKQQKMDTCWPSHKVEVFRNATYDSYDIARQKARKAEYTSDLNTDTDDHGGARRKVKKKMVSSSDSESDDLPVRKGNKPKAPTPIKQLPPPPSSETHLATEANASSTSIDPIIIIESKETKLSKTPAPKSAKSLTLTASTSNGNKSTCECYCPRHVEFNSEILRQLFFLRSMTTELLTEVGNLKLTNTGPNPDLESVLKQFSLPLENEENLLNLEEFLNTTENFKKVELEISKWGGSNLQDFIKRVMGLLISNQMAVEYSWLGRRDKKEFSKFNIAKVIIEAAVKAEKCKEKKEAEAEIARWLRRGPDRLKAFRKKNNNNIQ